MVVAKKIIETEPGVKAEIEHNEETGEFAVWVNGELEFCGDSVTDMAEICDLLKNLDYMS